MKLLLALLIFPSIVFCQDIPKNANTLTIHNVGFSQVVNSLLDSGFKIDKMDKEFGTIKTEYKKICDDCVPQILFDVRVKDSVAKFSGSWRSNGNILGSVTTNSDYYIFPVRNIKGRVDRTCFAKLNDFVIGFGQPVAYSIQ